jgi:hypothetical protein
MEPLENSSGWLMGYFQYPTLYCKLRTNSSKAAATQPQSRPWPPRCYRTIPLSPPIMCSEWGLFIEEWGGWLVHHQELPSTSYSYQIHFIPVESVCHALYVVGGLKGATPYHTITPKGSGPVVGFWVGLSLGTCCRIWLGPPIHFILIPDPLMHIKGIWHTL